MKSLLTRSTGPCAALALLLVVSGCGKKGPTGESIATACKEFRTGEGYAQMEEIEAAGTPVPHEAIAACLEASTTEAIYDDSWKLLLTRLERASRAPDPSSDLQLALVRAEAVFAYAHVTERYGTLRGGVRRFERLATQLEEGAPARAVLEEWHTKARDERIGSGYHLAEIEGQMVAAEEIDDLIPRRRFTTLVGKPVVLHNVRLVGEAEGKRSGDALGGETRRTDAAETELHQLLLRWPVSDEVATAALEWNDSTRALVEGRVDGVNYDCEATVIEVTAGEATAGMLQVSRCRRADATS